MWKVIGMSMLLLAGQAYGSEAVGCKARQQAVKDQLVFAKAHGNTEQVAGLERALRNIETHEALYYPSTFHAVAAVFAQVSGQ